MLYALGILLFVVALAISIALHEGGHMVVARWLKLLVPKFFVGFGPKLFSRKIGATEYGLRALPAGGYVEILPPRELDPMQNQELTDSAGFKSKGEQEHATDRKFHRDMLSHVSPWKRILVFVAGPAVNIVLGVVLLTAAFWTAPTFSVTSTIESVNPCGGAVACAADGVEINPGDTIVEVNGKSTPTSESIAAALEPNILNNVTLEREGLERTVAVRADDSGHIGINFAVAESDTTFVQAVGRTGEAFASSFNVILELPDRFMNTASIVFGAERNDKSLGSVVSTGNTFGVTASSDALEPTLKASTLLAYTGLFNLSIGFINLLPLMPLDGGRIAIALFDLIRRPFLKLRKAPLRPINTKIIQGVSAVTVSVVLVGFGVIILADVISPAGM